jgi:hypothetical protein
MARNLTFSIGGASYAATPTKVERARLYGWSETLALDDDEHECRAVSMDETGTLIIPPGGLGMGILNEDGRWVDRSGLKYVTLDGKEAPLVKSSYEGAVVLEREASAEEFLDHSITAVYQLDGVSPELLAAVGGRILAFVYSFRDAYEGSQAFLLANSGVLFMLVGYRTAFEMLSLAEAGAIEPEEDEEEESGEIDFSMGL